VNVILILAVCALSTCFIWSISSDRAGPVALSLASLLVGAPLLIRSIQREPVLNRLLFPILAWQVCLVVFHLVWLVPFYAQAGIDALSYHQHAVHLAGQMRGGEWRSIPYGIGNMAVVLPTALLYAIFGPAFQAMFLVSAMVGLGGAILLYRAFAMWQPAGRCRLYALILFFLPSLGVWRTLYGKDSLVMLGLGLACYGYSAWLARHRGADLGKTCVGVVGLVLVRPHVGFMVATALVATELWRRGDRKRGFLIRHAAAALLFLLAFAWFGQVAKTYVSLKEDSLEGMLEVGIANGRGNAVGGSVLANPDLHGLMDYMRFLPEGLVRLFLRPFPWEAHNANAWLAALENVFLVMFMLRSLLLWPSLLRNLRRQPYCLFSLMMMLQLMLAFSLLTNLGLVSRMKAQIYPFLLTLVVASPKWSGPGATVETRRRQASWVARPEAVLAR